MNNNTEESNSSQVNQSFLEFHEILDRSNPTIAKQLLAGISETDPGDLTNPPEWHQPWNTAIQRISDALKEAGKNWQPSHQRQVAGLIASGLTAWAKAATSRQRAQNPEDSLNPQVLLDLPRPALFHRTILADPWQLASHTRRIAQQLQQNDPRRRRLHPDGPPCQGASIPPRGDNRPRALAQDRLRPRDKPVRRATTGHHRDRRVHQQPLEHRPRPADGTRPGRTREPTGDISWHRSASSQEVLGKILTAFAATAADLSPAETEYLTSTLAYHLALPTTTAVKETEDTEHAHDLEVEANRALQEQDLNTLAKVCRQLQHLRHLALKTT